jgi:hypothetical protein
MIPGRMAVSGTVRFPFLFGDDHFILTREVVEVAVDEVVGQLGDGAFPRRIDPAKDNPLDTGRRGEQDLAEDERGGGDDVRDGCDLLHLFLVVDHRFFHAVVHQDVRGGAENFGLHVLLEPGHDPDRADQGGDAERNPGNRDDGVEGDGAVASLRAQVPQSDEDFVGQRHVYFSGLSCGKRTTSRIED